MLTALCFLFLPAQAQWDARKGLRIAPVCTALPVDSSGLTIDLRITYFNDGPDSLFMVFVVPSDLGEIGNASEETPIPIDFEFRRADLQKRQCNIHVDLEGYNIETIFCNGKFFDSIQTICLPPLQDRSLRFRIHLDSLQFMPPHGVFMQLSGHSYTDHLDQVIADFRASKLHLPTNPHGRRVYGVDVAVPNPREKASLVTCENAKVQLEEPYVLRNPVAYLERTLREWEGIGPWTVSRTGNVIVLQHKEMGRYYSNVSPAPNRDPRLDAQPYPVALGIAVIGHAPERKLLRMHRRQLALLGRYEQLQKKNGEYKTSGLDSKLPAVQRKVMRRYKLLPTHLLDPKHDLLVFTWGPNQWLSLVEDDPVTRDCRLCANTCGKILIWSGTIGRWSIWVLWARGWWGCCRIEWMGGFCRAGFGGARGLRSMTYCVLFR